MTSMKNLLRILVLLAVAHVPAMAAPAAGSPGLDRIDFVNLKTGELVIADRSYKLAPGYKVRNTRGKVVSAFNLRKGKRAEVRTNAKGQVTEIILK